jgi:multidrug resistance protein, MATE family
MIANLLGYWVLGLPLGLILCFVLKWGIHGIWIGLTVSLVIIASILTVRWHRDSVENALAHSNT